MKYWLLPLLACVCLALPMGCVRQEEKAESPFDDPVVCALTLVPKIQSIDARVQTLVGAAERFAERGQDLKATEALNQAAEMGSARVQKAPKTMARMAGVYARVGKHNEALSIARSIGVPELRAMAMVGLIESQARTGDYEGALRHLGEIQDQDTKLSALGVVAGRYAAVRTNDRAFRAAETVEFFRTSALAGIVGEYAEEGRYEEALQLTATIDNPEDRARALIWISDRYAAAGRSREAGKTLDRGLSAARKIGPADERATILLWIVDESLAAGQAGKFSGILDEACQAVRSIDTFSRDEMAEIAIRYADAGDYERALAIAAAFRDDRARVKALVGIADRHSRNGERDQATGLLCKAVASTRGIKDIPSEARALSGIAQGYGKAGDYEKALLVAGNIKDPSVEIQALNGISGECLRAGNSRKALEALTHALLAADTIMNASERVDALTSVALQFARTGRASKARAILSRALALSESVPDPVEKADLITLIAGGFAQTGDKSRGSDVLLQGVKIAQSVQAVLDRTNLLTHIGAACAACAPEATTQGVLKMAVGEALSLEDAYSKSLSLIRIARIAQKSGQTDEALSILGQALKVAGDIPRELARARVLSETAVTYAALKQYGTAVEIARGIIGFDAETLGEAAEAFAGVGYAEQAREALSRALRLSGEIEEPGEKARALILLAKHCSAIGEDGKASDALDQALQITRSMPAGPAQSERLASLAKGYADGGRFEDAFGIARKFQEKGEKARLLAAIVLKYPDPEESPDAARRRFLRSVLNEVQ